MYFNIKYNIFWNNNNAYLDEKIYSYSVKYFVTDVFDTFLKYSRVTRTLFVLTYMRCVKACIVFEKRLKCLNVFRENVFHIHFINFAILKVNSIKITVQ